MAEPKLPRRFQVLEELARSDAEIVLRARDDLLQREVVISRPNPGLALLQDTGDVERSLRQARALARLQHPGIVRLIDVLETADGPLLVMEPVPGETLGEVLARERILPPARVRELALGICRALEAVHAAGVVHRGVSASNVVIRADGSPCLTGFIFAKFGVGNTSVPGTTFLYSKRGATQERRVEPPHPAPEQVLGQTADARADVFGLGWVLYQCLTGEAPYAIDDCESWKPPQDPRKLAPGASKALAETVLRCLAPKPLKRLASAKEVREALEADVVATPGPTQARPGGRSRRKLVAGSALGVVALAVLAPFVLRGGRSDAGSDPEVDRGYPAKGLDAVRTVHAGRRFSEKYELSHALLIGIGEVYAKNGFPALPNAEPDIEAIAKRLKEISGTTETWDIQVLEGSAATRANILAKLSAVTDAAKENDKVFVYYAGHGVKHEVSEQSGWILPADALTQDQDPSRANWVRFDDFVHLFDETRAKHVLVAMDCCYSGRLITGRSTPDAAASYSRKLVTESAKVMICSGRENEQVSDGVRGEGSPFARAFLEALSRTDVEAVTTAEIYGTVLRKIAVESGDAMTQLPSRGNPPRASPAGEVVFFLR